MDPDISLGGPVDLLAGLQPRFRAKTTPWRVPSGLPLVTESLTESAEPSAWEPPTLSLHDSLADLLTGLFDYQVCPMIGLDGPLSLGAGELMISANNDPAFSRAVLGLEQKDCADCAFLLARLRATRPAQFYTPEWEGLNRKQKILQWLTPKGRHAMARLRLLSSRSEQHERFGDITARQARRYLDYFDKYGTHIVRSVSLGECLYQVFTVSPAMLPSLRDMFRAESDSDRFTGPMAFGIAQFTRSPWVARSGPIMSANGSAAARAVVADALWRSDSPDQAPSLLTPAASIEANRNKLLCRLEGQTPVAVSFACQALYMEDFRADAWHRVLRGGLTQQYPECRRTGWRARSSFQPAAFLASAKLSGEAALCRPLRAVASDLVFALDLTQPDPGLIPTRLMALFATTEPQSGGAVTLKKSCPALDPQHFKLAFTDGCIHVSSSGGSATLIEGVWLDSGPDKRPRVAGAPADPDPEQLLHRQPQLLAYVRLMDQMQGPLFAPGAQSFMRRCAKWLVDATSGCSALDLLHLHALLPARRIGWDDATRRAVSDLPPESLASTLQCARSLLSLPPNDRAIRAGTNELSHRLRDLYAGNPGAVDIEQLKQHAESASRRIVSRFETLGQLVGLPEPLPQVFAAGTGLRHAADPQVLPNYAMPGDHPVATVWNGLLAMRSRYAECHATIAMHEGDITTASGLLEREPLTACHTAADPVSQFVTSVSRISSEWTSVVDVDLRSDLAELVRVAHSATLLRRINALAPGILDQIDPQLARLLLVLELFNLSRAAGLPVARLDTLAPEMLLSRTDQALTACRGNRLGF